jgi:hypothetical protein
MISAEETTRRIDGVLNKTVELAVSKQRAEAELTAQLAELTAKTAALTAAIRAQNRRALAENALAFVIGLVAGFMIMSSI